MNFIDLFAGIGGFRRGLERAGHTCIGFCEIDKFARQTYKANFDTKGEWEAHDITIVTDDQIRELKNTRTIDIICGGFPCQAFSIAGKRLGFNDTRGTLFFEICRFAKIIKPEIIFLENVKGLLSHNNGRTFFAILDTLGQLGYDIEYQVLNTKDFGVPQNRERVFLVGRIRGASGRKIFPIGRTSQQTLKQIIPGQDAYRVYDPNGLCRTLKANGGGAGAKTGLYLIDLSKQQPKITDQARTLQARYAKGIANRKAEMSGVLCIEKTHSTTTNIKFNETGTLQAARLDKVPCIVRPIPAPDRHGVIIQSPRGKNKGGIHEVAPTISAHSYQQNNHVISSLYTRGYDGARIRRLTPLECFRLQSYPDSHWQKAKAAKVSDYQLYKQAGNSVTVDVVYEIAKRL